MSKINMHASRKVDISYFYSDWFFNRLNEGVFHTISTDGCSYLEYDISSAAINKIYIHTKNPYRLLKNKSRYKSTGRSFEFITHISMYDKFFESKIAEKYKILGHCNKVGSEFSRDVNAFSYGPVFKTSINDIEWHLNQFRYLCDKLSKNTHKAYINFDVKSNLCDVEELTEEEKLSFIADCRVIATAANLSLLRIEDICDDSDVDLGEHDSCPSSCQHCPFSSNNKTALIKSITNNNDESILFGRVSSNRKVTQVNKHQSVDDDDEVSSNADTSFTQLDLMSFF